MALAASFKPCFSKFIWDMGIMIDEKFGILQ